MLVSAAPGLGHRGSGTVRYVAAEVQPVTWMDRDTVLPKPSLNVRLSRCLHICHMSPITLVNQKKIESMAFKSRLTSLTALLLILRKIEAINFNVITPNSGIATSVGYRIEQDRDSSDILVRLYLDDARYITPLARKLPDFK